MKKAKHYPKGIYTAIVKNLKKEKDRYILILQLTEETFKKHISIDIHDYICENIGISNMSTMLRAKILSNFPSSVRISNGNGYWEIENESQILSDVISKSI